MKYYKFANLKSWDSFCSTIRNENITVSLKGILNSDREVYAEFEDSTIGLVSPYLNGAIEIEKPSEFEVVQSIELTDAFKTQAWDRVSSIPSNFPYENRLFMFAAKAEKEPNKYLPDVKNFWDLIAINSELTEDEISEINAIINPVARLDSNGFLVIPEN